VFGTDTVHLRSPFPREANLPGNEVKLIYELDIDLLTTDQRQALAAHLSVKFGYTEGFVNENLDAMGCPILADDVSVSLDNPMKWIEMTVRR
jgi:hypothetical protein